MKKTTTTIENEIITATIEEARRQMGVHAVRAALTYGGSAPANDFHIATTMARRLARLIAHLSTPEGGAELAHLVQRGTLPEGSILRYYELIAPQEDPAAQDQDQDQEEEVLAVAGLNVLPLVSGRIFIVHSAAGAELRTSDDFALHHHHPVRLSICERWQTTERPDDLVVADLPIDPKTQMATIRGAHAFPLRELPQDLTSRALVIFEGGRSLASKTLSAP